MKFLFQHEIFDQIGETGEYVGGKEYTEASLPSYWHTETFKWFLEGHILKLEVGQSISSEWHRITRLE